MILYVDYQPMAFTEVELRRIEQTVGQLCRKRSPVHLRSQVRLEYSVKGHDVVIYERREPILLYPPNAAGDPAHVR